MGGGLGEAEVKLARRHPQAAGWLLLGALLAVAYLPVVAGRQGLLALDAGVMPDGPWGYAGPRPAPAVFDPAASAIKYVPYTKLVSEGWRRGEVPFWNPYSGAGVPLWANGEAFACAPLRIPLYASPTPGMWNAYYLGRLWLAGGLAFSLALSLGFPFVAALAAGVAYMFGGYMLLSLNLFHLDVDALLPGLLLALDRLVRAPSRGAFAVAALVGWCMCLGGSQQALVVDLLLAVAWVLVRGKSWRARGVAALAGAAAAAGALPHWLPFLELMRRAHHLHGADGLRTGARFLPASALAGLPGQWLSAIAGGPPIYYAGTTVLVLAVAGAWLAWGRPGRGAEVRGTAVAARVFAAAVVLDLAVVFGVPGFSLIRSLPVLVLVWWAKYAAPLFLGLAMLAGYAIARAAARRPALALGLAALVAVELLWLKPGPHPAFHDPLKPAPYIGWLKARIETEPGWRICGIGTVLVPNMSAAFGLPDVRLEDTLIDRGQYRILFDGISAPKPPHMSMFVMLDGLDARRLAALRGLGVRWLVSARDWRPPPAVAHALSREYRQEVVVWRVSGARPFAGFPERGRAWFRAGCAAAAVLAPSLLLWGLLLLL